MQRERALPIDPFTDKNQEIRLDDWLHSFKRAAHFNGWSKEEQLLQFAGHLCGRGLQEWNLLDSEQVLEFDVTVKALQECLNPRSKVLVGKDFWHTTQKDSESVANFIQQLEHVFQMAYRNDRMGLKMREAILYGQLQDGLHLELIRS